jgi:hypothetical protein
MSASQKRRAGSAKNSSRPVNAECLPSATSEGIATGAAIQVRCGRHLRHSRPGQDRRPDGRAHTLAKMPIREEWPRDHPLRGVGRCGPRRVGGSNQLLVRRQELNAVEIVHGGSVLALRRSCHREMHKLAFALVSDREKGKPSPVQRAQKVGVGAYAFIDILLSLDRIRRNASLAFGTIRVSVSCS